MNAKTSEVIDQLRTLADPSRLPGMARVGINVERAIGVSLPNLRTLARRHRPDHELALGLWETGIGEARILASMVDDTALVTDEQMERWVADLDSWDVCDQVCGNLFERCPSGPRMARSWVRREEAFVKRAGFAMIAGWAVHDRTSPDDVFASWFPVIRRGAIDERNYVKKSVSWALRNIGKRSLALNAAAVAETRRLLELDSRSARWIGRDALRELQSEAVLTRLRDRS